MVGGKYRFKTIDRLRSAGHGHPSVVHQHVQPVVTRREFLHQVSDRLLRREIADQQLDRTVAGFLLHVGSSGFAASWVPGHHDQVGTLRGKGKRDLHPHACVGARYHDDLPLKRVIGIRLTSHHNLN